jgi:diguanylate cyclase (GGDEF)-like protein
MVTATAALGERLNELKSASEMPSPTGVALAVLELTQRDDSSPKDVAKVIQSDPALAGRLLKFANSAFVGLSRPVVAIDDAVILLGVHVVRQLALGLSVLSSTRNGPCKAFDYERFWSCSLATALAAQALCAEARRSFAGNEAFTCGLLSKVGQLGLASVYPERYGEILAAVPGEHGSELITLERQNLAADHSELTAALLADWGLPEILIEAVHWHEQLHDASSPESGRVRVIAETLQLAAHIGRMCVAQDGARAALLPQLLAYGGVQSLSQAQLETLFDKVVEQWVEWGRVLEVPARRIATFADLLDSAQRAEGEAGEALREATRILIVVPEPTLLESLRGQLAAAGNHVLTASDAREGLQIALEARPSLVITDCSPSQMDGLGLCRALREARLGQLLYIIMLTAEGEEEQSLAAFEAGADDCVAKPCSPAVLAARVGAGERVIKLQSEVSREKEENRNHLAELAIMNNRLREAAMTDPLTGLPNRRQALAHLETEWASSDRTELPLACLMVDVDHFKRFNDAHGHDAGDSVLRETANVIRGTARASDLACRYGGEEFILVCTNTDADAAKKLGERLRLAIESYTREESAEHVLTVSVGAAVRTQSMSYPTDLVSAADRALLFAKRAGRNRVCFAS